MPKKTNPDSYWKDLEPRLNKHLKSQTKKQVADTLLESLKFFSFYSEDVHPKITANNSISPKLDLFVIYAHDQLRSALILYKNLNLAPAAIIARATFENYVNQRLIIKDADPAKMADQYMRFREIIILKERRRSTFLKPLPATEEARILATNPEWVDPTTGKLVKNPHWTAKPGMNFMEMVKTLKMEEYYSLYRTTSNFVHASPITSRLYNSTNGYGAIADEMHSRRMCILIGIYALDTLFDYCQFFAVKDFNETECRSLILKLLSLNV